MKIMNKRKFRVMVSCLLAITLLGSMSVFSCSRNTASASVIDVYLSFDGAVAYDEDGQAQLSIGDEVNVIAAVTYTESGSAKGEWLIDGEKIPVTFELPEVDLESDDSDDVAIATTEYELPTSSTGLYTIGFSLSSPVKRSSETIEYLVDDAPPPANPTSYIVQLVLGNGHANKDNEGGLNWHDELRMLAGTKVWIEKEDEDHVDNVPPLDECLATAVLPPNGDDFAIQASYRNNYEPGMDDFEWGAALTPRIVVDQGKGISFRTQLWEKDTDIIGGLLTALAFAWSKVMGVAAGQCVMGPGGGVMAFYVSTALNVVLNKIIGAINSGPDDFIGEDLLDLSSADLGDIYAEGGQRTYTACYDGENNDKKKGDFEIELIVYVEQSNVPAPSGDGIYEIQEFLHDGYSISGGNADSGNKEELRLTRLSSSTAGGTDTYTPNGEDDVDVKDNEVFLWEGAVSEPVRIAYYEQFNTYVLKDGHGMAADSKYVSEYRLWEDDTGDDENEFGTSRIELTMNEIREIAASDSGYISIPREFTYDDNGVERNVVIYYEVRVRKEPLTYKYTVTTSIDGGENVDGANTEGGDEEFRLTATDANGVETIYSPPDTDIPMGDDGTTFDWESELSTITLVPIGSDKYVVKSVEQPESVTGYTMTWNLWEDDSPSGPSGGDEQFGSVTHTYSIADLDKIIADGGTKQLTSTTFSGDDGEVDINFELSVSKELNY